MYGKLTLKYLEVITCIFHKITTGEINVLHYIYVKMSHKNYEIFLSYNKTINDVASTYPSSCSKISAPTAKCLIGLYHTIDLPNLNLQI